MNGMAISNSFVGGVREGESNVFIMERLSQTSHEAGTNKPSMILQRFLDLLSTYQHPKEILPE